ncbi:hypothetical protein E2P86_04265 [Sphingobacterium psychroaquaticum]|uniref:hypothetical protein n=1 Tax=Sphingobacterium psychroaquaticum TaxID=561061 RepID=UPI0010699F19|nr:hypothetical protein [Sphingobacterium psychroaquaticum]QBQ40407.1 hypothetical protein E2P86_04265 [Sphingobacterium psychroaquaticum]
MKKLFISILSLFFVVSSFAQEEVEAASSGSSWIWGPSVGYQYQRGSFVKISGWGLFAPNLSQYMKIDAGANFTWMGSGTTVIPELGFTYYLSNRGIWPFIKAEATPYTLTPKVGISLLSFVDIGLGYGIDINQKSGFKKLDGFTGSINFNLPLNFFIR